MKLWIPCLLLVCTLLAAACTSVRRTVGIPNSFRVLDGGNPVLEAEVKRHIEAYVFSPFFQRRRLAFEGDVVVKTVPAVRRDRLGVPFWTAAGNTRDRSGGLTLFTGKKRPIMMIIAVMPDGTWDSRTVKHEACHAVLLWNGRDGHPPEFRGVAPLWY